ncbi:hypothetical protein QCA50_017452 [Cerrena zonata]|uniref:Radical SAM core domain-containing protein n=1 Tax=Cerrena zonata TaxID=2478898 RepID=A0AAW0FG47_9APHY
MIKIEEVLQKAQQAKDNGSTRFCMGAAWRDMTGRKSGLKRIGEMVTKINEMGMETCVTLGMVNEEQAADLKKAGLTAYNHNIDTSREHYPNVISTRSYDERLKTIDNVQKAGIKACTGGRYTMKEHEQFLCFMAGCNAIFTGEKMLTTMCNGWDEDIELLRKWGLKPMKSFRKERLPTTKIDDQPTPQPQPASANV